jgi:hypothetical protein
MYAFPKSVFRNRRSFSILAALSEAFFNSAIAAGQCGLGGRDQSNHTINFSYECPCSCGIRDVYCFFEIAIYLLRAHFA